MEIGIKDCTGAHGGQSASRERIRDSNQDERSRPGSACTAMAGQARTPVQLIARQPCLARCRSSHSGASTCANAVPERANGPAMKTSPEAKTVTTAVCATLERGDAFRPPGQARSATGCPPSVHFAPPRGQSRTRAPPRSGGRCILCIALAVPRAILPRVGNLTHPLKPETGPAGARRDPVLRHGWVIPPTSAKGRIWPP